MAELPTDALTRRLLARGSMAVMAQGINSAGNFTTGILAARLLGVHQFGSYAVLFAALLVVVALQTSWVGDSLTVLNRREPAVRRGIATWQLTFTIAGALIGAGFALVFTDVPLTCAAIFGVLVAGWQLEEFGRRLLMARLEFNKLALNELVYLLGLGVALALTGLGSTGLPELLGAMGFAAFTAFGVSQLQVPKDERLTILLSWSFRVGGVATFGFWRGAQSMIANISGVTTRYVVIALGAAATLGNIEAARLLVAPLFVVVATSSNFLVALFSSGIGGREAAWFHVRRLSPAMAAVGCLYGAVVMVFMDDLSSLIVGHEYDPSRIAVAGWVALAVVVAAGNPALAAAAVHCRQPDIFVRKAIGTVAATALGLLVVSQNQAGLLPFALAAGTALGGYLVWRDVADSATTKDPAVVQAVTS